MEAVAREHIRVWRSLVSRLNGVQEASSSNLDTRTKNRGFHYEIPCFLLINEKTDHSDTFRIKVIGLIWQQLIIMIWFHMVALGLHWNCNPKSEKCNHKNDRWHSGIPDSNRTRSWYKHDDPRSLSYANGL